MSDSIADVLSTKIAERILKQPNRVIKPEEPLISSGLIDSFSLVDLALIVEDEFGVRIDDSELNADTFDTLDALVKLIESRK
ncbi:acyl carrier protein [Leptolinea tardivitalis]|uniref:acyl carrier protein n=1 Tax=Leptolinea tardivitalis TaxID=229920 RepID=UPI000785CE82|nr:acyl carrier protein [Leptolinea tardivitalis]GAP22741.1 acyl carrier protein [Leptolinea tardivitalis]